MAENRLNEMEMAIMAAVSEGLTERPEIGKYARTIVNDIDAWGPTLWTEKMVRYFADTLDALVDKGYLKWETYILAVLPDAEGEKYIAEHKEELTNLPKVVDSSKWFTPEWMEKHLTL